VLALPPRVLSAADSDESLDEPPKVVRDEPPWLTVSGVAGVASSRACASAAIRFHSWIVVASTWLCKALPGWTCQDTTPATGGSGAAAPDRIASNDARGASAGGDSAVGAVFGVLLLSPSYHLFGRVDTESEPASLAPLALLSLALPMRRLRIVGRINPMGTVSTWQQRVGIKHAPRSTRS
jgi:hypothetical protein